MLSNQLRVGNRVYIDGRESVVSAADILTISQNERFLLNNGVVSGIFLSEALLLKNGFSVSFSVPPLKVFSRGSFQLKSNSAGSFNLYVGQQCVGRPVAYLHQLQNLFFLLSGEEL